MYMYLVLAESVSVKCQQPAKIFLDAYYLVKRLTFLINLCKPSFAEPLTKPSKWYPFNFGFLFGLTILLSLQDIKSMTMLCPDHLEDAGRLGK